MSPLGLTFMGTATNLLEVGGLRLLTDPVFDPPGTRYPAVEGLSGRLAGYTRLSGPAVPASGVGRLDAVLLSHDHHGDNLDAAGRALLPGAGVVLTTIAGARRLRRQGHTNVVGLAAGATHRLGEVEVTAAPARHGPPGTAWLSGPVIGFFLRWPGGSLYVSGDTVWHAALERFAREHVPEVALMHVGAARFGATFGLRFTADAGDVLEMARVWPRALFVPVHFEGWSHFSEGRVALAARLEQGGLGPRVRWPVPGRRVEVSA